MPAGLQVFNNDGYLQVTEEFKNFVLVGKGSVALAGTNWNPSGDRQYGARAQISIPNTTGYPPVLALRCDTEIALFRTQLVSGNWVYDIISALGLNKTNTVYWFAFGPTPNVVPSTAGLEVRTAANELAYHSSYLPMVVTDYRVGSAGAFANASGRTIAMCILSSTWGWSPQVPAGTWQQFLMGTAIKTTGVNTADTINNLQYGQKFAPANYGWPGATTGVTILMSVDVTNY